MCRRRCRTPPGPSPCRPAAGLVTRPGHRRCSAAPSGTVIGTRPRRPVGRPQRPGRRRQRNLDWSTDWEPRPPTPASGRGPSRRQPGVVLRRAATASSSAGNASSARPSAIRLSAITPSSGARSERLISVGADGGGLGQALGRRRELPGRVERREALPNRRRPPPRGAPDCARGAGEPEPGIGVVWVSPRQRCASSGFGVVRQAGPQPDTPDTRTTGPASASNLLGALELVHGLAQAAGLAVHPRRLRGGRRTRSARPSSSSGASRSIVSAVVELAAGARPHDALEGAAAARDRRGRPR